MKTYTRVLTIAGSDSGGGAGIQADLKTISALGCYGLSVVTALTAQNTLGVTAIHPVPAAFVTEQLKAVLSDIGADAVKIGMLHSPDIIQTIADTLLEFEVRTIVIDPVMVATSGDKLLQDDAIDALKTYLLPMATVITPNLPEAGVLLGRTLETFSDLQQAANDLSGQYPGAILIKGGHLLDRDSTDILCPKPGEQLLFPMPRIITPNSHGTGCSLSSAIAAGLAKGLALHDAVEQGKNYLTGALQAGAAYKLGHGHGPIHHFFSNWQ